MFSEILSAVVSLNFILIMIAHFFHTAANPS